MGIWFIIAEKTRLVTRIFVFSRTGDFFLFLPEKVEKKQFFVKLDKNILFLLSIS